ncbi:MAG: hypothetical protein R3F43_30005 [bacterium]
MPRKIRFVRDDYRLISPRSGQLVHAWDITTPVIDGCYLLRPDLPCLSIVHGVLGRAQSRWQFDIFNFHVMSTHWHLVGGFTSLRQKARVMRFLNGEIARRINKLRGRRGPLFERRHQAIQIMSDADLLDRVGYVLSQGTKAFVVRHPSEDPFACGAPALLMGKALRGTWLTGEQTLEYEVQLSPVPFLGESLAAQRPAIWEIADTIARTQRVRRKKAGRRLSGPELARTIDPRDSPARLASSASLEVHGTATQRAAWRRAYRRARHAYS